MKKIVICIDSFKGSLTSLSAGKAVAEAAEIVFPGVETVVLPLADGGEGTMDAILYAGGGEKVTIPVTGPLGNTIEASYGILPQNKTAVIEMSAAAGITLVPKEELNPMIATTRGVGEMILDAISRGCRNFLIGIGGSATNDGGVGMLSALGFSFTDKNGNEVSDGAEGLSAIHKIQTDKASPALSECTFRVACDVKNVLCGEEGCSAVYGPQKGATPEMIQKMDAAMENYASRTKEVLPGADALYPGCGAAGGMGFALLSYLSATLVSGINLVMEQIGLASAVKDADLVVTGEGRLDGQSVMGKAPVGVSGLAKKYGKLVVAFSGCVEKSASLCNAHGIDAFFPIVRKPCTLEEAMDVQEAFENLKCTAEQAFRLMQAVRQFT